MKTKEQTFTGRLGHTTEDFAKIGLLPGPVQAWEDGRRMADPMNAGEWEWWYADVHFTNGMVLVTSFHYEVDENGRNQPFIQLNLAQDGQVIVNQRIARSDQETAAKEDYCDVRMGQSYFRSTDGLDRYEIYIAPEENNGFGADLVLEKQVPSFRPGTGHWVAGDEVFAWLCAVPSAKVSGKVTIKGETTEVEGSGYHDHNWGNVAMDVLLKDWLWGRAEVDGYTVVAASVRFQEHKGGVETPLLYLAKDHEELLGVFNDQLTCLEGVKVPHPDTGKKISSDCIYLYEQGDDYATIRFDGQGQVIASLPWFNSSEEWETWYARFSAQTSIDLKLNGKHIRVKGESILENEDFRGRHKFKEFI